MARTANRGTMSASSPTSYNVMRWRLGKYIRLSKEDLLRGRDESNSVVNQRRLLEQYHQAHLDEFYEGAEADVYAVSYTHLVSISSKWGNSFSVIMRSVYRIGRCSFK